jgi:hypothetical protein
MNGGTTSGARACAFEIQDRNDTLTTEQREHLDRHGVERKIHGAVRGLEPGDREILCRICKAICSHACTPFQIQA